jgi:hypothetical protein
MDRIFQNSTGAATYGVLANVANDSGDPADAYEWSVKALIADAVDFEESELAFTREVALDYYNAVRPSLLAEDEEEITGDPPVDDDASGSRSTVVSSDVRDTILSIMPSLVRMFMGTEHAVEFMPNSEKDSDMATNATDYIRWKFWDDNDGFFVLYDAFWDALTLRAGIVTWGTEHVTRRTRKTFSNLTEEQLTLIMGETEMEPKIVSHSPPRMVDGVGQVVDEIVIEYSKSMPHTWVDSVAPEDFRISRNAKSVKTANLVGYEEIVRVSDLVEMGYDLEDVLMFAGVTNNFSMDRQIRNPGGDTYYPLNDQVRYGCFWVRMDKDGDGVNELRAIKTIGDNYDIIDDVEADAATMALFLSDRTPHTAIGGSIEKLVEDIQRIKTNLIRGSLDSLTQSIWPRSVFNELLTNAEDVMSDDIGSAIRTRGDPTTAVHSFTTPFAGKDALDVAQYMDTIRQSRTGISEASKGLDPKALQSTALSGIDLIASGAQERIEMIAYILANSGVKEMYAGLLKEVIDNPNKGEQFKVGDVWKNADPSLYDPSMRVKVNPAMGKGSDLTRLQALQGVAASQQAIIQNYGFGNGVVGPQEMRNTQVDILAIVNIRNVSRYYRVLTPEQATAIESAPKTPDANTLLAQSQMEGVKQRTVSAIAQDKRKQEDHNLAVAKAGKDEDFRRDKLAIDTFASLVSSLKDGVLAEHFETEEVLPLNSRNAA